MMNYIWFFGSVWKLVSENVKEISNFDEGGPCPGVSLSRGIFVRGPSNMMNVMVDPMVDPMVKSGWYASYWNAFLLVSVGFQQEVMCFILLNKVPNTS